MNNKEVLKLIYVGDDYWSRPVYKDQFNHLWKDVELGTIATPSLYSPVNNDFEGEPECALKQPYEIDSGIDKETENLELVYGMLSRLQMDCEYYLGYGGRCTGHLWAKSEVEQIEEMKKLWQQLPDDKKPQWLTWTEILDYEKRMVDDGRV